MTAEAKSASRSAPARVRMPIRIKITLPFLIMALVLAMGSSYVVTQIVFDTLSERFTNQLIETGKLATEWMVQEEERILATVRLLQYSDGVPDALKTRDAERLREVSFGITVNNLEEAVEFLDVDGNLLLAMRHRRGGRIEEYIFTKYGTSVFMDYDFARKVIQNQLDQKGDKFAGLVRADWGNYFYISAPVYDSDQNLVGAVLVGKTLETLTKNLREQTLAQVTLYDFGGVVMASTLPYIESLETEQIATIFAIQDTSSYRRSVERRRDVSALSIDYEEILGPWQARENTDLGLIGASLAKSFLISTSRVSRIQISLLFGLAFFLVIILGVNVANYITRPLMGLVHASEQVSRGNLKVRVPVNSNDEVAVLAQTFNQMIENLEASKKDLLQAYDSALEGWSLALEMRDKETEGHTERVTELTVRLARALGIQDEEQVMNLRRGALLHDIGKMAIPDSILLKEGPLNPEEMEVMRRHPEYANQMLSHIEFLGSALDIPLYHHERWDGTGYPLGLRREEIPLGARIFAVVDVWDAIITDRPYRRAMPYAEAIQSIRAGIGSHFDPRIAQAFLEVIEQTPVHD